MARMTAFFVTGARRWAGGKGIRAVKTLHTGEGAMNLGIREHTMIARDDTRTSAPPSVEEAKKQFLPQALPCPLCKTPPEELSWVYLVIPPWASKDERKQEGWVTICDRCKLQIDFFVENRQRK